MTSLARFIALILLTNALVLACALLVATDQHEAAVATGAVALAAFMGGVYMAAGSIPHDRIRTPEENTRIGLPVVIAGGAILLAGGVLFTSGVVGGLVAGTIFVVTGATMTALGLGALNAARMLRLVPMLAPHEAEPRALALGANAMPGRPRSLVVATDDRVVWTQGRDTRETRAIRFEDVDRFDIDHRTGTLTVVGGGQTLQVRPVPRRELHTFEQLLRGGAASQVSS
jgi:hypothetical protein